jgi:hypothetical protein
MRALILSFCCALTIGLGTQSAAAQAVNSYQSNEAWGTGTAAGGVAGAIMHQQFSQTAGAVQRARCGQPLVANTNQAIGTQIIVTNTGNGNSVNGNSLTATNNGAVNNHGVIRGVGVSGAKGC